MFIDRCDENQVFHLIFSGLWSEQKQKSFYNKHLLLESWTAFTSSRTGNHPRNFNYTRMGLVDTSFESTLNYEKEMLVAFSKSCTRSVKISDEDEKAENDISLATTTSIVSF